MTAKTFTDIPETFRTACRAQGIANSVERRLINGTRHAEYECFIMAGEDRSLAQQAYSLIPEPVLKLVRI